MPSNNTIKIKPEIVIDNIGLNHSNGTAIPLTIDSEPSIVFSEKTSDVEKLIMSNGIYDRYNMDWYKKFSRFGIIDPYNALTTTREYVFITKPDLCLMNTDGTIHKLISKYPFFVDSISRYYQVARQLQLSASVNDGPFMTMLSNSLTSPLDLPGISSNNIETGSNIMGTKISYRGTSYKSDEEFDFSLEFEDTKFLDIYMLFKMWDEYERLKWDGVLEFNADNSQRWVNYIINKVLHDQVAIYKFVVAEDGSRIIYWARLTGCVPTSVPRDAFSDANNNDTQKLTVNWKAHFVRDMDPIIIKHFNLLVQGMLTGKEDLPLYDTVGHHMDGRWSSVPYIEARNVSNTHGSQWEYFLKWKI